MAGSWEEVKEDWEVCSPFSQHVITIDKKMDWQEAK